METRAGIEPAWALLQSAPSPLGHLVDWQPVADLNRGHPLSESGALPTELTGIEVVRVGGFEPPVSCFQGRQGRPGSPTP
jgi:hypothetical protein